MATIDDIIQESGVSRSTVFRFLNGSNIRSEAKNSIVKAMEKLNYSCEALYKQQKVSLEISTSNNFEGFKGFSDVVQGITERANEKGISVNISRRSANHITSDYEKWDSNHVKGVIVIGKNWREEDEEAKMLLEKKIPHVFINRIIDTKSVNYVAVDVEQAAFDAVSHLISLGHSKIGTIGYTQTMRIDKQKIDGYKRALSANGIKVSDQYCKELLENEDWEAVIDGILLMEDRPTAFFGICDSHAMKIIHSAKNRGIKIPDDIAVSGMDDIDISQYFRPAISTIHIPFRKMGIMAVDNILQLISDKKISSIKTVVAHELIIRESCGFSQNPV